MSSGVEEYEVKAHCPECNQTVLMLFHTDNHERDSSSDSYTCMNCGAFFPVGMRGPYIHEID